MSTPCPFSKNGKEHKNTCNHCKKRERERKNVDLKGTWLLYDCCMVVIVFKYIINVFLQILLETIPAG